MAGCVGVAFAQAMQQVRFSMISHHEIMNNPLQFILVIITHLKLKLFNIIFIKMGVVQSISLENVSLETVLNIQDTLTVLVEATAPSPNGTSALPMDLQVTANYLQDVVNYYSRALDEGLIDAAVAIVVCYVLMQAVTDHN